MPYIKLLTALTALALLTACGGGGTDDKAGKPAVSCDTNPYGADCGTGFETQRLNIVSECRTDNTGDFCNDAITFFCDETTIRDLLCRETKAYKDLIAMEQNECLTRTGSQPACDEEERVKNCEASAFSTNCADTKYVMQRESRCLANIQIDDSCRGDTGIATVFCKDDPFNTSPACMADTYLPLRITNCITAGNAGIARCNNLFTESASNTCLTNPFTDACTSDGAFATYADTARVNRVSFCGISGNAGNTLCSAGSGYADCVANPFATECGTYFESAKAPYCTTNPTEAPCVVNTADWVAGFRTAPNTAGDRERTETHEFLQGTEDGLNTGNVRDLGPPNVITFTLELFEGEAKNGVAWFVGGDGANGVTPPIRLYAGIFSGTDLGAPLTSADVSVSVPWKGTIGWFFFNRASTSTNSESNPVNTNFDLTVDFANSEIRAFVARGGAPPGNTNHFLLKATFDDRGRFDGTINHGTFAGSLETATPTKVTTGVLTGLIGELGAVGAFISNQADIATTDNAFVGGFVAISPKEVARIEQERLDEARKLLESQVTFTDWIGGFDPAPPATPTSPATNQFLAGTTTLDPLTNAVVPLTLTSTIGGVGFFTENGAYYAGLLANTNVGLPVEITPQANSADVTATWPGKIRAIGVFDGNAGSGDTTTQLDLNVVVNLTARTFTATRRDPNSNSADIIINGLFPAINNGVVTGTVTQGHGNFEYGGQLTGIIGQDGVVGAFYSNSDVTTENRYVGGFYAAPQ